MRGVMRLGGQGRMGGQALNFSWGKNSQQRAQ
jgi:hypothetical protein